MSVFIVLANDGWTNIFANHYRAGGAVASCFFFVTLVIIGQYVLLNLFIAILILNFEQKQIIYEAKKRALFKISNWRRVKRFLRRLKYRFRNLVNFFYCCRKKQLITKNSIEKIVGEVKE